MGLKSKITNFTTTLIDMVDSYNFYYDKIKELTISMYEWKNLPDGIDERFLELTLFERGCVVFFRDEALSYLALPCSYLGRWNVYNVPKRRVAFASNGYHNNVTIDNSVLIYNNVLRTSSIRDCRIFARRLSHFDRTIDLNVEAQKTPIIIRCSEKERLTMKNLAMQYQGGQPFLYVDSDLSAQPIEVLKTDAPYVADKIYDLKTKYWNEMLTFRGITNLNIQKKERLITDEVMRSQGGTIASRYSGLMMRKQAAEQINKMFGLDIYVECRADIAGEGDGFDMPEMERGADDE